MGHSAKENYIIAFIAFLIVLSGCHSSEKSAENSDVSSKDTLQIVRKSPPIAIVPVKLGQVDSASNYDLEDHLFGKFFGDRAGFYIINNPDNRIFGHKVLSITLYYLDGKLYKTKYVVNDNLVNDLINIYPRFHIRGFDETNREILKTKGIYYRMKKRWYLNDSLSNYDIQWKVGSNNMRLRINKDDKEEPYQYIIKNRHYEEALASIERHE